ncbi:hypothetical protein HQQ94_09685 [Shewanella sp. VB17]|uniref:hypothetical protein n=1 Tax=Shewanella sp. VB17 TaxID=2739432 RepID=UPI0015652B86|nr:hypothetical protein [Shewanella sp. VB17]NRD73511.1 hypothetical protein [Shewanella sp. VB17]
MPRNVRNISGLVLEARSRIYTRYFKQDKVMPVPSFFYLYTGITEVEIIAMKKMHKSLDWRIDKALFPKSTT